MRWGSVIVSAAIIGAGLAAQTRNQQPAHVSFALTSSAFSSGGAIPREYTCDGPDQSPQLVWSGVPAATVTFALVMHDPDAPAGDWVHWDIWNVPLNERGMDANVPKTEELPNGMRQGRNDFRKIGYNGPCPPSRKDHKYVFQLYAVDTKLDLAAGASRVELESALKGHVLAEAEYMGTYRR